MSVLRPEPRAKVTPSEVAELLAELRSQVEKRAQGRRRQRPEFKRCNLDELQERTIDVLERLDAQCAQLSSQLGERGIEP